VDEMVVGEVTKEAQPLRKILTFNDILSANDIKIEEIDVPEWGGVVRVRTLRAEESAKFVDDYAKDKKNSMVRLLVMSAVDANDQPLFTDAHVELLRQKSFRAMARVQEKVLEMNGLTPEKKDTVKNA